MDMKIRMEMTIDGDGGETGLYSAYQNELPLISRVPPLNNSLLFFEVTPLSYHSFLAANTTRNCFVWWYHTDIKYAFKRNALSVAYRQCYIDDNSFEWWENTEGLDDNARITELLQRQKHG